MKLSLLQFALLTYFLIPTLLFSQKKNKSWEAEMQRVNQFFERDSLFLNIEYFQQKRAESEFEKIDECQLIKIEDAELTIFSDYETFVDKSIYIKADHIKQLLYVFKSTESPEEAVQQYQKITVESLSQFGLYYDSLKSSLELGKLVFNGNKNYKKLVLEFNPENKALRKYTIYYGKEMAEQLFALDIRFTKMNSQNRKEYQNYLSTERYIKYTEENFELNPSFEKYKLIRNF